MIKLLDDDGSQDGAEPTFSRVIELLNAARQSVEIYMYVWRNDAIGNAIGQAVLAAAERGVKVLIFKDVGAIMYERTEMNRKSFFPEPLPAFTRAKFAFVGWTLPDSFVDDDRDWQLGTLVMQHENVTIRRVDHTHSKYYLFDEETLVTGSINIEDRHRGYRDYMVEIGGGGDVTRFRERLRGGIPADLARDLEFLVNRRERGGPGGFEIKPALLELLANVRERLYIEMAYIGDPDVSDAIVAASRRGVEVSILFSREANIGNDINYRTLDRIWEKCDLRVFLTDKMIHSKLMLFDGETVIMGSANISVFSMQKAVELDVLVRGNPQFLEGVKAAMRLRLAESRAVTDRKTLYRYNRPMAMLQQLVQKLAG